MAVLVLALLLPAAYAADAPDPRLAAIVENALQRDELFDRIDAKVSLTMFAGEDKTPQATASGHWLKDGDRTLGDYAIDFNEPERKGSLHVALSFDGKVVRIVNYTDRSGTVMAGSRDFYRGGDVVMFADSLGVQHGGVRVSDLLQGKTMPDNATNDKDPVDHTVSFVGDETVNGQACVVMDVTTESAGVSHSKRRFYLAADLGYAPVKIDMWLQYGGSEKPLLLAQTLSNFKQSSNGVWYAIEGRLEGLGGRPGSALLTLDKIEFPPAIDPALFNLEFPAGTNVYDAIAKTHYVVGHAPSTVVPEPEITGAEPTAPVETEAQVPEAITPASTDSAIPSQAQPPAAPTAAPAAPSAIAPSISRRSILSAVALAIIILVAALVLLRSRKNA